MERKQEIKFPNLVAEMARRGENQKDVAELIGTSQPTFSRKLRGLNEFTINEAIILCKHYEKEYSELFEVKMHFC